MSNSTPLPPIDRRLTEINHLDLPCTFIPPRSKGFWANRARELREHVLASMGLWPLPDKCPLNVHVFDRQVRDGYSIEKVYFESFPGFFVTGNLYRPLENSAPCPGILNPHGHWRTGRLADEPDGSVIGRCINFARQGSVAFAWDMIGYNDNKHLEHGGADGPRELLWGMSKMGLQLWNSIRSVDFMISLPDVDSARIACTGASGGGTQTFLLTAVDDRVKLSAPVNMISGHMQGGCVCENGPNLRIGVNNIEIGATMAPRPMLMVSATGDWTVNTPSLEYPAIQEVYRLYDAEERVSHVQIDAGHNYNIDSRNAVYAWFGKWLFGSEDKDRFTEKPFTVDPPETMLVFSEESIPANAADAPKLTAHFIKQAENQFNKLKPTDAKTFRKFRQVMNVGFRTVIGAEAPEGDQLIETLKSTHTGDGFTATQLYFGRAGVGDRTPATYYAPLGGAKGATLVVSPEGRKGLMLDGRTPGILIQSLLKERYAVLSIDAFLIGEAEGLLDTTRYGFYTTYNRPAVAHRVQDIVTAVTYLRKRAAVTSTSLIALGEAGLWGLLACGADPHINRAALDTNQFDSDNDEAYLSELNIPGIRRIGDVRTAAALAAPASLLLHNTGSMFETEWISEVYRVANAKDCLTFLKQPASTQQMVKWAVLGPTDGSP